MFLVVPGWRVFTIPGPAPALTSVFSRQLWGPETFDWKQNYAIHVYYRLWKDMSPYYIGEDVDPENLKTMNNTFGAMARSIYYGSPELIPVDKIS